jgi:hypothetical protein
MRRGRNQNVETYINMRVQQLKDDMNKAHDPHDKNWYNRLIQELEWTLKPDHNCWMAQSAEEQRIYNVRRTD